LLVDVIQTGSSVAERLEELDWCCTEVAFVVRRGDGHPSPGIGLRKFLYYEKICRLSLSVNSSQDSSSPREVDYRFRNVEEHRKWYP
jgi:hypothetical protein